MAERKEKKSGGKEIIIGGISSKERLLLIEQLHAGIRAGYSITDTIELSLSQATGRLKRILEDVLDSVENGAYIFEAFEKYPKYFPPVFISLIKTGELSASLEESLMELHILLKKDQEFNQKIRSALTYPTFVLIAIFGLGLSVSLFIFPNILPLFKSLDTELPTSTKILLWFAEAIDAHGKAIFWGILGGIIFFVWLVRRQFSKPVTNWLTLRIPIVGKLQRKILMMRFSQTMHSLLKSGITVDQSLAHAASALNNIYYSGAIRKILPSIAKGETLTNSLHDYPFLFEELFMKMMHLGEKTGSLEESFFNISEYYGREVDNQTKILLTSLEPILLIFVGLIVGFVAISILGPIYSISGSIN